MKKEQKLEFWRKSNYGCWKIRENVGLRRTYLAEPNNSQQESGIRKKKKI